MPSARPISENRRASRDIVSFHAAIEGAPGARGSVLVVDISPYGFMARCVMTFASGDAMTVRLPVIGARPATVRWSLGGRLGGEFDDPITAHGYARLLARAPHDRPAGHEF